MSQQPCILNQRERRRGNGASFISVRTLRKTSAAPSVDATPHTWSNNRGRQPTETMRLVTHFNKPLTCMCQYSSGLAPHKNKQAKNVDACRDRVSKQGFRDTKNKGCLANWKYSMLPCSHKFSQTFFKGYRSCLQTFN